MAETTYTLLSSWLPVAVQATEMYLQNATIMPAVVQTFGDRADSVARKSDKYTAGTVADLTDGTDISTPQTLARTPFGTVTPAEYGDMYFISDQRMASDNVENIMADLTEHIGYSVAKHIDTKLMTVFGSVTAGTVGAAGSSLTWQYIFAAAARLRAAGVPAPYNCVLHEYAWYDLGASLASAIPLTIDPALRANRYYVATFGDISFYTTGLLTAGTALTQAMFNRRAIAYDVRRPLTIELQRDASKRGYEVVFSTVYGYGLWRADMGCQILCDASAP